MGSSLVGGLEQRFGKSSVVGWLSPRTPSRRGAGAAGFEACVRFVHSFGYVVNGLRFLSHPLGCCWEMGSRLSCNLFF